jgi:SSS family solute:Na+ symporter
VPAVAAKVVVVFHLLAYGLLQFVFDLKISFIHIYAILFLIEVAIMLIIGARFPAAPWHYKNRSVVDLTPWRFAQSTAVVLFAAIIISYLLFSPIGLVGGLTQQFWIWLAVVLGLAAILCWWCDRRWRLQRG